MRRHTLVAPLLALMLLIPTATAYAEDQEVFVHVLPTDTLAISIHTLNGDQWADFGGMELGETRQHDMWLNVVNTTTSGFDITVTGGDLESFDWEGCDQNGCWNPTPTVPLYTIPSTNLVVAGGDLDWWDGDAGHDVVVPSSVAVTTTAQTIVSATEYAHGEFGFDNPMASMQLTVPAESEPMQQYRTVLTYTITGTPPA